MALADVSASNLDALFGGSGRKVSRVIRSGDGHGNLGRVSCTIGVFDGLHAGHRKLISDCISAAESQGIRSVILTFDPDPAELFSDGSSRKLMSNADRIRALSCMGADAVLVKPFDRDFSKMQPGDFLARLMGEMTPVNVYVGENFRFGFKAAGDVEFLKSRMWRPGCEVEGEELLQEGGEPISATRIRNLLEEGKVELANKMLRRPFYIHGEVVEGRHVGRTLGFPTANLVPTCDYVNIHGGVYIGYVLVDGAWYRASISVGVPKTFGNLAPTIEAHLIDFDEDIYGEVVTACFTRYLRPMMKFDSTDQLVEAIAWYTQEASAQPADPGLRF